jgi:hypothetical protein
MITEAADRERSFDTSLDPFSVAGRAALVGGALYAINQTEFPGLRRGIHSQRQNKLKTNLAEKVSSAAAKAESRVAEVFKFGKSKYAVGVQAATAEQWQDIDAIMGKLTGGHRGESAGLGEALKKLYGRHSQLDKNLATSAVYKNGQLAQIRFKSDRLDYTIPVVDNQGFRHMGRNLKSAHPTRGVYQNVRGGALREMGVDVAMTEAFEKFLPDMLNNRMSSRSIHDLYEPLTHYDEHGYRLSGTSNPHQINLVTNTKAEDPALSIRRENMDAERKKVFMEQMAREGRAGAGTTDSARGYILNKGSILDSMPFANELPDPKKTIRDVKYTDTLGNTSYTANKKTLFASESFLSHLRDVMAENGRALGELAPDQAIINGKSAGTLTSNLRRISVAEDAVGSGTEWILDQLSNASGMGHDEVSSMLANGGLSSFAPETQQKMKSIQLGMHKQLLEEEKAGILASKQAELDELMQGTGWKNANTRKQLNDVLDAKYDNSLKKINEAITNSDFFGYSGDHVREVVSKKGMERLFIDDIYSENGQIKIGLRRQESLREGDKLHSASGEGKVIVKNVNDELLEDLTEAYKRHTGLDDEFVPDEVRKFLGSVDMVVPGDALKQSLESRTAGSYIHAARQRALQNGDNHIVGLIDEDLKDWSELTDEYKDDVFRRISNAAGVRDISEYVNEAHSFGHTKNLEVAFGYSMEDIGSGANASFSRRHLENFEAMGLGDFVEEILANRTNSESVTAAMNFQNTKNLLNDKKFTGTLKVSDLTHDDIEELFPSAVHADANEVLAKRQARLKELGFDGNVVLDLEQEVEGQRRIMLLNGDEYYGMTGARVGANPVDGRRFSELDESVRSLLYQIKGRTKDPERLARAMSDYNRAINMVTDTMSDGFLKGKVSGSLYGMVTSAPDGLSEYTSAIMKHHGVKESLPSIAVVSDEDFSRMYGRDALDDIQKQVAEIGGPYKRGSQIGGKNLIIPKTFGMATREPVEGLSHIATAVLPSSMFTGNVKTGMVGVIRTPDKDKGIMKSIMDFVFGDSDGDHFALLPSNRKEATEKISDLIFKNNETSLAYRMAHQIKGELSLKGTDKYGKGLGMLDVDAQTRRVAAVLQRVSEKGNIGIVSKSLEPGHSAVRSMALNEKNMKSFNNFLDVENTLHFVAEFGLKGKHQSLKDLESGKAMQLVENLVGNGSAQKLSFEERQGNVLRMFDEMLLGEGGHDIANKVRSGTLDDAAREALASAKISSESAYFKRLGTMENIGNTMKAVEDGVKMGKNTVGDIIEFAAEGVGSDIFKSRARREAITETIEHVKSVGFSGMKNLAKYALAPAAAIGLIGTIAGSRGEIRAEPGTREYTDGQKAHYSNSHIRRPVIEPQMRRPKYEQVNIRGESNQSMFNENRAPGNSNIRMEDHRKTFDRYEIQEMVERGI